MQGKIIPLSEIEKEAYAAMDTNKTFIQAFEPEGVIARMLKRRGAFDDDDDDEDEYPASKEDPINAKKTAMEDEMEDIAQELDNVTDPDEKADLEYRYDSIDKELSSINNIS